MCCDDERGNGDRFDYMACAYAIVVVGSAGVPSIRGCIAIVEFAHPGGAVEFLEVPLAGEERGLSSQSRFQFHEKMSVVNPVARLLQGLDAFRGVDIRADCDCSG